MLIKSFFEALKDGYKHITEIADRHEVKKMRDEGIQIDTQGLWTFTFGEKKEYELRLEPFGEEEYLVALYKNNVLLTQKLPVKPRTKEHETED